MGNSAPTAGDSDDFAEFDGIETLGYRFLNFYGTTKGKLSSYRTEADFCHIVFRRHLNIVVWNIKSQEKRLVELVPNDDWPGAGLLGVTIRLDNYGGADERLIRVLEVEHNSPAAIAGLVPMQDYLLGTTAISFESTKVLAGVLDRHCDKVVEIYVYNSESDIVRVVALMPTRSWGAGNGLLGAEVGVGYLHRLPNNCRQTIGQSVERKVRLKSRIDDEETEDPTLPEMEPHLEMEVENDDPKPEDISRQPHELGSSDGKENRMTKSISEEQGATTKAADTNKSPAPAIDEQGLGPSVGGQNRDTKEALPVPPDLVTGEKQLDSTNEKQASRLLFDLPSPPKMTY
eukprot:scaffold5529_cov117-Cylindrotheca_fusiformis.AAC.8